MERRNLPEELRQLMLQYEDLCERSTAAWCNTSGSVTDNAARVRASDRLAENAQGTMERIEAYCREHGFNFHTVRELM